MVAPAVTGRPVPPDARTVSLRAGDVQLRDFAGPAGAPTIVLLHGWSATADINFYRCYQPLAGRFRVLAFDQRGHGDGIRTTRPFRLTDCAADVVELADRIGVDTFIPVGYSLGGTIAQVLAKAHAARVPGVVFCCTAARFGGQPINRLSFAGLAGFAAPVGDRGRPDARLADGARGGSRARRVQFHVVAG